MGLRSVSASKDVIGDPSRPGTNNSELLEPRREEKGKVLEKQASFHFNRAEKKRVAYCGKKFVFRPERNVVRVEQERSATGNLIVQIYSLEPCGWLAGCRGQMDDVPVDGRGDGGQGRPGVSPAPEAPLLHDRTPHPGRPRLDTNQLHQAHPGLWPRQRGRALFC